MEKIRDWFEGISDKDILKGAIVIAALLLVLYGTLGHMFLNDLRTERLAAAEEAKSAIAHLKSREDSMDENFEELLAKRSDRAAKMLPDEMAEGGFLEDLQLLAFQNHMRLLRVTPGEISAGDGYETLPVTVLVEGDYFALTDFLKSLQDGERFIQITALETAMEEGKLRTTLKLSLFATLDKSS